MNFSVTVPTYNRPKDLSNFLNSLFNQSLKPTEVLIIDDGDLEKDYIEKYKNKFSAIDIDLIYYKKDHSKERRGLSESKNKALDLAGEKIIFFFDDDIILDDPHFLQKMMKVWEENDEERLIGVGGLIKGARKKSGWEKMYNKFFGLNSTESSWDITDAGFQVWNECIIHKQKGYYVHGGVTSFRREVAKTFQFATFSGGRTGLEDVDFCLRAKNKGYYFIIEPKAKVIHNHVQTSKEKDFLIGQKESKNRKEIFQKNCKKNPLNYFRFFWGNLGWVLKSLLAGRIKKALGMLRGLF